ncbi:MAG: hypothetical protein P8K66_05375 [Planctomycetota bacterium]|nr:hypothetical protein [Planctomycetota bacterium]
MAQNPANGSRSHSPKPMDIHNNLDEYFRVLHEDPYGLKNSEYNWNGEDRFVAVVGSAYLLIAIGMLTAAQSGLIPALNFNAFIFFCAASVFELGGKIFCSHLVLKYDIRINFVRKLGLRPWRKLQAFVIPFFFVTGDKIIIDTVFLFSLQQLRTIVTEWNVIRRHVPIFRFAFVSWDRLEDRPYSMRYDMIEDVLRFLIYIPFIALVDQKIITLIPQLVNEFGDGLAEPVGLKFGKHKYKTKAIWHDGKFWNGEYYRSLEGSAMVFLVTVLALLFYSASFTTPQLLLALACLPLLLTLAEAVSPHTADGPLIGLLGCGFLWALPMMI